MHGKTLSFTHFALFATVPSGIDYHAHRLVLGSFVLSGALLFGFAIYWFIFRIVLRRTVASSHHSTLRRFQKPAFWLFLIAAAMLAVPAFGVSERIYDLTEHTLRIIFIVCLAWLLFTCVYAIEDILERRYDTRAADNLRARRVRTQMTVIRRLAFAFIVVLAAGLILYTFHHTRLWQAGAGLLASAGLATLVLATAAKSTVSNLLAGIQIAFTEPIRLEDAVIVENEWGWVEEITAAYVVIRIWDLRRLIVPLSYFIEHPFQNWTRTSANLLGTVFLYVDYTCPIEPLRTELTRLLKDTDLWDKKVNVVQVTDLSEQTKQIRLLVSSDSSGRLFDLRCYVRENMIGFMEKNYPQYLPKQRVAELQNAPWEKIMPGTGNEDVPQSSQHG